jgi:hypothetical protein
MKSVVCLVLVVGSCALASQANAAISSIIGPFGPADLDTLMGTPLLPVTDDGNPVGTAYGNPPTLTPGISLATPIGPMGFEPTHDRVAAGTPTSSGAFHALPVPGPIAGSDVVPPVGANAIDFYIVAEPGSVQDFEITAIGTLTTTTISIFGVNEFGPVYVGFGAFGETLIDISIVKLPKFTPTTLTWNVSDIRVLPVPGTGILALGALGCTLRRRR